MMRFSDTVRLSDVISKEIDCLSADSSGLRRAQRAAEVHRLWKDAVSKVYGDAAPFVLSHVNAVYIMRTEEGSVLDVYTDDSLVRSDIDARQEFLKMALRALGEHVETFRIKASRFSMKANHPFVEGGDGTTDESIPDLSEKARRTPIDDAQLEEVRRIASRVENLRVRAALENAMVAEIEFQEK